MIGRPPLIVWLLCAAIFFANGCAFDVIKLRYDPAPMDKTTAANNTIVLQKDVGLTDMPCSYTRILKKDKKWQHIGNIEKGDVYKPIGHCFTVECSNVFEAYLVLNENRLVGFYLPVEKSFVAMSKPTDLPIN